MPHLLKVCTDCERQRAVFGNWKYLWGEGRKQETSQAAEFVC